MARPGARLGGDLARPVWRYRAGGRIELQLHDDVAAEHRNVNVLVASIDDYAMRLGLGVEDLGRFRLDDALRIDRIDRQLGADIGGGEHKFPGAVGVDVRHLVDQRGCRQVLEPAGGPVDGEGRDRIRFAAELCVKEMLIRAGCHRQAGRRRLVGAEPGSSL